MESLTPLWLMRRLLQWEARRTPPTLAASADAGSTANVKPLAAGFSSWLLTFPAERAQGRLSHV
jgi:CheY-like chemotaxis protein